MMRKHHISQKLLWSSMIVVIIGVFAAGIMTNITLRSVEKNLPITLLTELNDLSVLLEHLADVVRAAESVEIAPEKEKFTLLHEKIKIVTDDIDWVRESYVFDNLIHASTIHTVVAPAVIDLETWLVEGVSGFGPESVTTAMIVRSRIEPVYQKARGLIRQSRLKAQTILADQRTKLDTFLVSANILFGMMVLIALSIVYLLVHQYILHRREVAAQAELREQSDLLNSLFDNVLLGIMVWDRAGTLLFLNRGFVGITGYSTDEVKTLDAWYQKAFPDPDDRQNAQVGWDLLEGQGNTIEEFQVTCKDGAVKDMESRTSFLQDGRALLTLSDISDRKKSERMLKESREIKARARKMESLGLLAGGVAHDLNNILSGIVSYPELLLLDIPQESELRRPMEMIMESGQRAAAIVLDLLTVARGVASEKEPLGLNDLVRGYIRSPEYRKVVQLYPDVSVTTSLDPELFNINGSKVHIGKVIMNLVLNSSEAIAGAGRVTLSTTNRYVDEPLRGYEDIKIGEYAVLTVSDDGSGIAADDLARIFEPFYTKKVLGRSGTGLGLAVVWNVVQDHDGYINVSSQGGKTTFELYFPVTEERIPAQDIPKPLESYMGAGETILIIDDQENQRRIASKVLRQLGYLVTAVASGEEAVDYLRQRKVDLILLDMIMDPGMNGRETYEKIIEIYPGQKAIIASGYAETLDVKETQALGAGRYIRKPFSLENIGMAVKEELERPDAPENPED